MRTSHCQTKMATALSPGGHSPTSLSRTLEKVLDDAEQTGEILLSGRKIKDFAKVSCKYDLSDATIADISKNRFSELPPEICELCALERLNCYHNIIRCIPEALVQLQSLVHLNISRNQLTTLPPVLCQIQSLEVLLASNNRLVSLPEEINKLEQLMEIDVSCNEIAHLPTQIGDLESLRCLNVRKNLLVELPSSISKLSLRKLDVSCNRLSKIPCDIRKMEVLTELCLDNNPLTSPPAHICTKGRVHVMKFLHQEALKEDRKRGVIAGDTGSELRKSYRKSNHMPNSNSDEFSDERRKRAPADSGYNTCTAESENPRAPWSPSEESPFSKELQRQKSDYESRKRRAEQLRLQLEEEEKEKDGRCRAATAQRLQEEQQHLRTRTNSKTESLTPTPSPTTSLTGSVSSASLSSTNDIPDASYLPSASSRRIPQSNSFREDSQRMQQYAYHQPYRRTISETAYPQTPTQDDMRLNGHDETSPLNGTLPSSAYQLNAQQPIILPGQEHSPITPPAAPFSKADDEFRHRHETLIAQQRREAQMVRKRLEDEKQRIRQLQKEAVYSYFSKRSPISGGGRMEEEGLPAGCQRALEAMSSELGDLNPAFTIRRQLQHAQEEMEQIEQLRHIIESRLKVSLPDDLSAALKDGVVLCHLANHVRPRSVPSIHVPSPAVPKLPPPKCRKNVENFLDACRKIGVDQDQLCSASSILEERDTAEVALSVKAFVEGATNSAPRLSAV